MTKIDILHNVLHVNIKELEFICVNNYQLNYFIKKNIFICLGKIIHKLLDYSNEPTDNDDNLDIICNNSIIENNLINNNELIFKDDIFYLILYPKNNKFNLKKLQGNIFINDSNIKITIDMVYKYIYLGSNAQMEIDKLLIENIMNKMSDNSYESLLYLNENDLLINSKMQDLNNKHVFLSNEIEQCKKKEIEYLDTIKKNNILFEVNKKNITDIKTELTIFKNNKNFYLNIITSLKDDILIIQNENKELQNQKNNAQNKALKIKIEKLQNENKELKNKTANMQNENKTTNIQNENKELKNKTTELQNENKTLKITIEEHRNKNKTLQITTQDHLNDNKTLKIAIKEQQHDIVLLNKKTNETQYENTLFKNQITEIQNESNIIKVNIGQILNENLILKSHMCITLNENKTLFNNNISLKNELNKLEQKINETENKINKLENRKFLGDMENLKGIYIDADLKGLQTNNHFINNMYKNIENENIPLFRNAINDIINNIS
jgi:chromosome segregation ATPase